MRQHRRIWARVRALSLCLSGISALAAASLAAQSHHFVYLSTAAANTISGFELMPASGTLAPIAGSPFNQALNPGAMTLHPSRPFLYVMNAGDKSVSAFKIDPVTGVLNEAPASPFAVGAVGYTPKLFLVEPSGRFLYVVSTLDDALGTVTSISYYSVDQATGALDACPSCNFTLGPFTPAGLVSKPGDKFLYLAGTASPASGSIVSIRTIELDPDTGEVSNVDSLSGRGNFAHSVAISPDGQFLFVGRGQSAGSIDTYTIPADGIPQYSNNTFPIPPDTLALPYALAVDASGSHLYAAVAGVGIRGFAINAVTGALSPPVPPSIGLAVSPSAVLLADPVGQFLYYEQRRFGISDQGALNELSSLPLTVAGSVTGIAAANPLDAVQPISAPQMTLAPSSLLFSDQYVGAASQPRQVSLSNTGNAPLILNSIVVTGTNNAEYALSYPDCSAVLLPSNGCTILITFQPRSDGVRQATLTVEDNAIGNPHMVALTGTGRLPFTFQLDSPTASVPAGQIAQYNLRLVPATGFVGQVSLACSGAPAEAACEVPPSLQLDGVAPTPFSVRVPTTARSVVLPRARPSHPGVWTGHFLRILPWGLVLTLFSFLFRRLSPARAFPGLQFKIHCAVVLLAWVSLGLASCAGVTGGGTSSSKGTTTSTGSTSNSPPVATGTPAGLYTLTLAATFDSAAQTIQLDLAVQ